MNSKQYEATRLQVEELTESAAHAEGQLKELMKQLEADFGCSTFSEATKKLKQLKKEAAKAREEFENELEAFNEKYEGKLKELVAHDPKTKLGTPGGKTHSSPRKGTNRGRRTPP